MRVAPIAVASGIALIAALPQPSHAAPPTEKDVDTYSQLCKIGSQSTLGVSLTADLAVIARRILAGEAKLSGSKIQDEFPGIRDEKNRLLALQSFQDCMYRYVERFHPAVAAVAPPPVQVPTPVVPPKPSAPAPPSSGGPRPPSPPQQAPVQVKTDASPVGPTVAPERRREIVFLANELDTFKQKMGRAIAAVPQTFYDKRDSTEKMPRGDHRLVGLADFTRYKAFQSATGGLDFSNATNNDIALLCSTYTSEILDYYHFSRQYQTLALPRYDATGEARRICHAAGRGR
jgi:hypothetical protein